MLSLLPTASVLVDHSVFFIQLVCIAFKNAVVFLMFILISAAKIR
jgi:hypothetical protein